MSLVMAFWLGASCFDRITWINSKGGCNTNDIAPAVVQSGGFDAMFGQSSPSSGLGDASWRHADVSDQALSSGRDDPPRRNGQRYL